jgi:putative ABC transport system substrate-binding protein
VRNAGEIEREVTAFANASEGGLIVTGSPLLGIHRETIIALADRHRLPAVYPYRHFVVGGGLISFGPDLVDQYRRAASYVDRIFRGEKPADLPIQLPTKFETLLNLKTANSLGIKVPTTILLRADEVIE